ncbi:MAG: MmgE/PrpD family protein, partial [Armatimonadetes bacterium]|nr:MmgE/PrpD family protein [Armatimonadota bacterium]
RVEIHLKEGKTLVDEIAVSDAHSLGARPFARSDYLAKFHSLAEGFVSPVEGSRFLKVAQRVPELAPSQLYELNVMVDLVPIECSLRDDRGIF